MKSFTRDVEQIKDNTSDCKWDEHLDDYNNYVKEYNKHYLAH
jgi:hypothetical protein